MGLRCRVNWLAGAMLGEAHNCITMFYPRGTAGSTVVKVLC